jgi:hypothetical protein
MFRKLLYVFNIGGAMVGSRKYKYIWMLSCIILISLLHSIKVSADMGPKPQITVIVKNPPSGEYYLDLLTKDKAKYQNLESKIENYNKEKLSLLLSFHEDYWHPALTQGTKAPMWGDLIGEKKSNQMIHTFGYMGVPDDFKLIIITPDNKIIVTKEIHKQTFDFTVTYDYNTGEIKTESLQISYGLQFLMSCLPTLLIEGIVLIGFGFSIKKNWKVFLLINILTQIFLTVTMGTVLLKEGLVSSYFLFFPIEFIILIIESIAYAFLLKEHSILRRIGYGILANAISCMAGFVLILFEYSAHHLI